MRTALTICPRAGGRGRTESPRDARHSQYVHQFALWPQHTISLRACDVPVWLRRFFFPHTCQLFSVTWLSKTIFGEKPSLCPER